MVECPTSTPVSSFRRAPGWLTVVPKWMSALPSRDRHAGKKGQSGKQHDPNDTGDEGGLDAAEAPETGQSERDEPDEKHPGHPEVAEHGQRGEEQNGRGGKGQNGERRAASIRKLTAWAVKGAAHLYLSAHLFHVSRSAWATASGSCCFMSLPSL